MVDKMRKNFLVEIGTEELPPKALKTLGQAFASNLEIALNDAGLAFEQTNWYASPRRLAVKVEQLICQQADKNIEKRGPAIAQAFDAEGQPTKAALGWARGCGIEIEQADRLKTDKGEWLLFKSVEAGKETKAIILDLVAQALSRLPIPKAMRWGDKTVQFIRPVHTVTLLFGDELIEGDILGVASARNILGHRFMGEQQFEINNAEQYPQLLKDKGCVIADFATRREMIKVDAEKAAEKLGGIVELDEDLLDEVTALVEYPVVLTATFEERFLDVPAEALVYTMKGDQKYFPVYDSAGKLLANFIFVSNINPEDPTAIISGNGKVVRPRLSDAEFFFKTDLKQSLEDRLPQLEKVLFQQQLGTVADKSLRIEKLSGVIAELIGADAKLAKRAGLLSKCDLMTNMVFEFTDTQGVMGMHYARHDGEHEDVAVALNEQYMPRFSGDELPASLVACSVALADKIDTLVGIFGIGQYPKGDKDPFALRRAALGVLRIIVEKELAIDLEPLLVEAVQCYGDKLSNQNTVNEVLDFMLGRFRSWYQDAGFSVDVIQAVLACRPTKPSDFDARVKAVTEFRKLDEAEDLAAINKRVSNILAKVKEDIPTQIDRSLCIETAEIALTEQLTALESVLVPLFATARYNQVLDALATLQQPTDKFFEEVMVNAEDLAVRANRQAILNKIHTLFLSVADISLLQ